MKNKKVYLGDSVYCNFNGYQIVLTTENGAEASNTIYLEGEVIASLLEYIERLKKDRK